MVFPAWRLTWRTEVEVVEGGQTYSVIGYPVGDLAQHPVKAPHLVS